MTLTDTGRPMYYDRQGNPMTLTEWSQTFNNPAEKIVARTQIAHFFVSTVWLDIDHSFHVNGPPLIFETMIFLDESTRKAEDNPFENYQQRYSTEAEAKLGHEEACEEVREVLKCLS